jgi:rhamnosyltransferase
MSDLSSPDVLAVVVTYNAGPDLPLNLAALVGQCREVVVVDNGSHNAAWIEETVRDLGLRPILNKGNVGIATAFNQAADIALELGVHWLATFDQDSLCPPNAIKQLLALAASHPQRDRIGVVAMAHRDRAVHRDYHHAFDILEQTESWQTVRSTISSGSMVRMDLLQKLGAFEDRLFIDSVDHELCLRIRKGGWMIVEARKVIMLHSIGDAQMHLFLGRPFVVTNHSALRRYYMVRNQLEVSRRNVFFDPLWALKGFLHIASLTLSVLLFERERRAKLWAILRGMCDFVRRRFGVRG